MVNFSPQALDSTFAALSDPTRRAILTRLAEGEASILQLKQPYSMSLPAFSKHVRVLEQAGLLERRKVGREHRCRLAPGPLQDASNWLTFYQRFWLGKLDALDDYLRHEPPGEP